MNSISSTLQRQKMSSFLHIYHKMKIGPNVDMFPGIILYTPFSFCRKIGIDNHHSTIWHFPPKKSINPSITLLGLWNLRRNGDSFPVWGSGSSSSFRGCTHPIISCHSWWGRAALPLPLGCGSSGSCQSEHGSLAPLWSFPSSIWIPISATSER